jgi:hypothetical protein
MERPRPRRARAARRKPCLPTLPRGAEAVGKCPEPHPSPFLGHRRASSPESALSGLPKDVGAAPRRRASPQGRRGCGDRHRTAREHSRCWTPEDRDDASPLSSDRPRLAPALHRKIRDALRARSALGPRTRRPPGRDHTAGLAEPVTPSRRSGWHACLERPARPRSPWCWVSAMSGGMLLSNTSSPFPVPR